MPHIVMDHASLGENLTQETTQILFEAVGDKERLVAVSTDHTPLLFRIVGRPGRYVIKCDKSTRIPDTNMIKRTLNRLGTLYNGTIIQSNIAIVKDDLIDPFLVNPSFFLSPLEGYRTMWIEVGFGSGRHLLEQAKLNPDVLVIGIEIHKPSLEQVLRRCKAENITNIRVIDFDARLLLQFIQSQHVEKIFVHFPIPWGKAVHRRVISAHFLDEAMRVLIPQGRLELRTDDEDYFRDSFELMLKYATAHLEIKKNADTIVSSKYEDRWKRQSKTIYDLHMINVTPDTTERQTFTFDFPPHAPSSLSHLPAKPLVDPDNGAVLHFMRTYTIGTTQGSLTEVVLGAFDRPERKFIHITGDQVSYYPAPPLGVKENFIAHQTLVKVLYGN